VPLVANEQKKKQTDRVLANAVDRLLRATKDHAKKKGQPIDTEQLRKDGFSDAFIQKVEEA
jgi:hypothetical protein